MGMKKLIDELRISSALAHMTRLEILDLLRNRAHGFNELKKELELNPNTLSFHIRTLREVELIVENEAGYNLTDLGRRTFEDLIQRAKERLEMSRQAKTAVNRPVPKVRADLADFEAIYVNLEPPRIAARLEDEIYLARDDSIESQTDRWLNGYM